MWWGPGQDPGGTEDAETSQPPPNQELLDLQDQFEHQQILIVQLKEMLRKNELTSAAQEKAEECVNTLNKISARPKRGKPRTDKTDSTETGESSGSKKLPVASEKINLLKQQLEETKAKLAERGRNQREIGEMVNQLNVQLDISQQANSSQSPLNLSALDNSSNIDLSVYSTHSSADDLYSALRIKDGHITELTNKVERLEASVIDLQENLKEKDSVIDARTKAITLMSESLSKKGKNTLDMLDDTKEQMRQMQENFVVLEDEMKEERERLIEELRIQNGEVAALAETNMELERSQVNFMERIDSQNNLLEKYKTDLFEFEEKMTELTKLNESLLERNVNRMRTDEDDEEVSALKSKVIELEKKLSNGKGNGTGKDGDEIVKLKKQLDESNKNSIKLKAQSKGKLKELQKKIDAFKNLSDVNAEFLKVQTLNDKLKQKITELQEEKGNLDSGKASQSDEDLLMKLAEQSALLEQRDAEILRYQTDVGGLEERIKSLNEKIFGLENAEKVTSEITTIHLEEQLEKLEIENKELAAENEECSGKIEQLKKEKIEIVSKLESYVQENIELMDKLEKLSAEKVSSAESIEIVENLTQQEKLELEAYNKNIAFVSEAVKRSDDNLSQTMELNESVNELTEETSELMAKIELFTEERREVMDKMDALHTENTDLIGKIREVENNRDVLAETYELLQNEKESLENEIAQLKNEKKTLEVKIKSLTDENQELTTRMDKISTATVQQQQSEEPTKQDRLSKGKKRSYEKEIQEYKVLVEEQTQRIVNLQQELLEKVDLVEQIGKLEATNKEMEENAAILKSEKELLNENYKGVREQLTSLQNQYEKLTNDNDRLSKDIKTKSEFVYEKDELEDELRTAKVKTNEVEEKLRASLEEIDDYRQIIEDNKNELISSAGIINNLQTNLCEKQQEVDHLNSIVSELNNSLAKLEFENNQSMSNNESLNEMVSQLNDLKVVFNDNMSQLQFYESEVEENSRTIDSQKNQLKELNDRIRETENLLHGKDEEIGKLKKEQENNKKIVEDLHNDGQKKEEHFHKICRDLKEKYESLAKQIDKNSGSLGDIKGPLEEKIKQLESSCTEKDNKNKEQMEKMKKIAANLKKKVAAYQELEVKYGAVNEKWEVEQREKDKIEKLLASYENKVTSLVNQLHEMEEELTRYKAESSAETQSKENVEEIKRNYEIVQNAMQMKIQEHEAVIESKEQELSHYKHRVNKLEEGLSHIEDRRLSLERKAIQLGIELEEKSSMCEEAFQSEDILEQRLAALTTHDDIIEKKLREAVSENALLTESVANLVKTNDHLSLQLNSAHHSLHEKTAGMERMEQLENEADHLNNSLANAKRHGAELEKKFAEKVYEFDTLETELNSQMVEWEELRKTMSAHCEHLQDSYNASLEEIEQHKRQIELLQNDLEEKDLQCHNMNQDIVHQLNEIDALKGKLTATNNAPNDVVQLEEVIRQKNNEIEHLQRQQSSSGAPQASRTDDGQIKTFDFFSAPANVQERTPFDSFVVASSEGDNSKTYDEINGLKSEISALRQKLQHSEYELEVQKSLLLENVATNEVNNVIFKACKSIDAQIMDDDDEKFNKSHVFDLSTQLQTEEAVLEVSRSIPLNSQANLSSNSKEEMLQKIKTLEFMLYTMEKEKEDVAMQCQHLTNEITRLVYDRQNDNIDLGSLEGQIMQDEAAAVITPAMKQELVEMEYTKAKPIKQKVQFEGDPVVEEMIQPKSAYLCYDPEEVIQASQDKTVKFDSFVENDDGWVWGPEEVKLEEEHRQLTAATKPADNRVVELEAKVVGLEGDVKKLQIKSAKLVKKLKEMKVKNDTLTAEMKKTAGGFSDLDDAIQDELKLQITKLEKRLKDVKAEYEKDKLEKDALLKRIDVLTAANERLIENKEKQDVDMQLCQQRNRELSSKLEQTEWENDGFTMSTSAVQKSSEKQQESNENNVDLCVTVEELNKTITELTLDNEELQAMLEEQRNIRLEAEKNKAHVEVPINTVSDVEHSKLMMERDHLNEQLLTIVSTTNATKDNLEKERNDACLLAEEQKATIAQINQQINDLQAEKQHYLGQLEDYVGAYNNYAESVSSLQQEKQILENTIEQHLLTIAKLNSLSEAISSQNDALHSDIKNLHDEKQQINTLLDESASQKDTLVKELEQLKLDFEQLQSSRVEDNKLYVELDTTTKQLTELRETLALEEIEFNNKLSCTVEQLTQEWVERVDQRGADVAESWKLHLDARENEFMQLENQLRTEIVELEEKCNGLVNENNELRKNVDTEIRNEVDRIAALQQQINDKERHIKDLTVQFHEQKTYYEQQIVLLQNLQEQLVAKDNCLTELGKELEEKQCQIENAMKSSSIIEIENRECQETIAALNKNVSELQSENNKNKEVVLSLQQDIAEKEQIAAAFNEEKQLLIKERETWERRLNEKQQEIERIKAECETNRADETEQQTTVTTLQDEVTVLRQTIDGLNQQLQENQWQIYNSVTSIETLQQQLNEKQETVNYLQGEIDKNGVQMEVLNNDLITYQQSNDKSQTKDAEINRLIALISEKDREHGYAIDEREKELKNAIAEKTLELEQLKNRLSHNDDRYEELLSAKGADLENLRLQLQDNVRKYDELFDRAECERENSYVQLEAKQIEATAYMDKINAMLEGRKEVEEQQKIIEEQVLKIEALKRELFAKSNDYDALIAELDVRQDSYQAEEYATKSSSGKRVHFAGETEDAARSAPILDNPSDPVSRAELDLALYMLHQRDVRCEELTVELMQLLEERDTLQLRLSNAIREKEDIASRLSPKKMSDSDAAAAANAAASSPSRTGAIPKSKAILLGATGTELATEVTEQFHHDPNLSAADLSNKLSQLRSIGYNKDVTIRDDQEARHLQQMSFMQQHRDVAALLPAEAAARLVDANYTLSRDVQSPSMVLLNWLWGRSTPKVNNV